MDVLGTLSLGTNDGKSGGTSYLSVRMMETTEGRSVCENVYVLLNDHVIEGSVLVVGTRSDTPPQGQESERKEKKQKREEISTLRDNEAKGVTVTKKKG